MGLKGKFVPGGPWLWLGESPTQSGLGSPAELQSGAHDMYIYR